MYISHIQKGIQTAHVVSEISSKYKSTQTAYDEWALNHKTIIVLNGGYGANLYTIEEQFAELNQFPFASFNESQEALGGAITAVGIILPEWVYAFASAIRGMRMDAEKLYDALNSLSDPNGPSAAGTMIYDAAPYWIDIHIEDYTLEMCSLIVTVNRCGLA